MSKIFFLAAAILASAAVVQSTEVYTLVNSTVTWNQADNTFALDTPKNKLDLCDTCIQFAGEALNELINLILNKAVIGSCGALCGALENATHSKPLGNTCLLLCDIYGLKAFINWISHADLSPIWECEQLGVCKANDNGDAKITSFLVSPAASPSGVTRTIAFVYESKNGTGTGEIRLNLQTVDHQQVSFNSIYLPESTTGGQFKGSGTFDTTPAAPGCDPTQSTCEEWLPGTYNASILICEGECGDTKHAHAKLYDSANISFTITNGPAPPTPPSPGPPSPPAPPGPPGKHYEDPNAGPCSAGEDAVQITGVKGSFCSPSCSTSSPCPTDVPDGATAKPTCALSKGGSPSPSACALICKPSGPTTQCPAKASCKKIQTVGICTYDE